MSDLKWKTPQSHGFEVGDVVSFSGLWMPWYKRFWYWITRRKPKPIVATITSATTSEFTIGDEL